MLARDCSNEQTIRNAESSTAHMLIVSMCMHFMFGQVGLEPHIYM